MSGLIAIWRKELRGYFVSPVPYAVAAVFWLLAGFFFSNIVVRVVQESQRIDLFSAQMGQTQSWDAGTIVLQEFLGLLGTLFLFLLPMITMGLYAEERRQGTMELLATSPLTNWAVAIGKWLAALQYFFTLLVPLLAYEILAFSTATPAMPLGYVVMAHLGLVLLAAAGIALGMFISALTDSTLIAAVSTFGLVLLLWVIDAASAGGGWLAAVLQHLSLLQHYQQWIVGNISSSSVILFATLTGLGIYLTTQAIEALRWQQN